MPVSAVSAASCMISDKFLDLSELRLLLLQDEDDSVLLTRQQGRMQRSA